MRFFKSKQEKHDEEFTKAWNEAIDPTQKASKRKRMSTKEIAEKLSEYLNADDIKSPAYILLDHELKCRVEKIQNFPQYLILFAMIGGIFLGWLLPQWKPLESKTSLDIIANHIKEHDEAKAERDAKQGTENVKLPIPSISKADILNPIKQPDEQTPKDKQGKQNNTKR
ncbi:MAG: hypothetical protein NT010_00320 [Proteobacteria bacterium]|nr:hypothetical protein [Pseudomonadota bacterium]